MRDRPDCPFIMDVLDSLKRRSKALKHQNATPVIERLVEIRDGKPEELVEVTFKKGDCR
jgi:hypothetical protein